MQYHYFIAYTWIDLEEGKHWTGNCSVKCAGPITSAEDIAAIAKAIENSDDIGRVVITNWKEFERPITPPVANPSGGWSDYGIEPRH